MPANAIQRTVAFDREASFADSAAKDWDSLTANGDVILCHDLTFDPRRPKIENKNLKQRAGATRPGVLGLRNHPVGLSYYWKANSANAAEGAQATRTAQDELLYNALGGEHRGYAAGIAAGTAASPTVEDADGDNLAEYGWSFFWDTSASQGFFRQYSTVTEGVGSDTLTMATGHTLPFTPDAGGADIAYACVSHYPHWDALEDHTHANHTTLAMFFKGRHTERSSESKGCKLGVEMSPIEQGALPELIFSGLGTTFDTDGISQPALTVTPEGGPGSVVGSGSTTLCYLVNSSSTLAAQTFWGQITPTFGIKPERVAGPNGTEGVHGHGLTEDSYDASMIEITVPFDDSWITAYHAETTYHMLVQIGTAIIGSRFLYCPLMSFAEEPEPVSVGGREGLTLRFNLLERDVAQGSLSEDEYHRARAKFTIGRVA
jgi:hypothetical protein